MLLPCGIDVFSGVEFVCCPAKKARKGQQQRQLVAQLDDLCIDRWLFVLIISASYQQRDWVQQCTSSSASPGSKLMFYLAGVDTTFVFNLFFSFIRSIQFLLLLFVAPFILLLCFQTSALLLFFSFFSYLIFYTFLHSSIISLARFCQLCISLNEGSWCILIRRCFIYTSLHI